MDSGYIIFNNLKHDNDLIAVDEVPLLNQYLSTVTANKIPKDMRDLVIDYLVNNFLMESIKPSLNDKLEELLDNLRKYTN